MYVCIVQLYLPPGLWKLGISWFDDNLFHLFLFVLMNAKLYVLYRLGFHPVGYETLSSPTNRIVLFHIRYFFKKETKYCQIILSF